MRLRKRIQVEIRNNQTEVEERKTRVKEEIPTKYSRESNFVVRIQLEHKKTQLRSGNVAKKSKA